MGELLTGRIGDRLIEKGLLDDEQLEVALNEQKRAHRPLGKILVSLGFVSQADITRLVAEDMGLEFLRAEDVQPDVLILSAIDPDFVRETLAFPYALVEGSLRVVMADPDDPRRVAAVRDRFPYPLSIAITTEKEIQNLLRTHVQNRTSRVAEIFSGITARGRGGEGEFPVESMTEAILLDGVNRGATDIHIEPEDRVTRVRYRIDGILQQGENLPREFTPAIVSRVKILSSLDISERRRPQDGRLRIDVDDRQVDMRVSVMPCTHGENLVLRILEGSGGLLKLANLGFTQSVQTVLTRITERPHGIFLVTGPTSAGKTTTLYAMLSQVDAMHRNVVTVEDPVEYALPLLRQSQVDTTIGFTFHEGLRSILRQDPDVILVGEIRDRETADIAIKASMTGHLVLSTLHTNNAIGAISRLVEIGIEPYLIEDTLIGTMAQRLVRRVCVNCGEWSSASPKELAWLEADEALVRHGRGCERCGHTGFDGRSAMMELFLPDTTMSEIIRGGRDLAQLHDLASAGGFRPMLEDGKRLVRAGATTMDEILRVNRSHRLSEEEREDI